MGTTELVQALMSPIEKLIDAVSGAIGKAYEPRHIKRLADAKTYELTQIADTVRNNSDVPIVYNSEGISIDTSNFEEIAKRASSRLAYQEITKQQNIEAVANMAYEELEHVATVSEEPVSPDWMFYLFNSVENISNEDLQKIWGRILAGEIKSPGTYSYRTLERLKNMTQQEAEHFQLVAALALQCGNEMRFILRDEELLNKQQVYFNHLLELEECGLMTAQLLSLSMEVSASKKEGLYNSQIVGVVKGKEPDREKITLYVYAFTASGAQLINAIAPQANREYILDCLALIRKEHENLLVTAHNINSIDGNNIDYDETDILPSE